MFPIVVAATWQSDLPGLLGSSCLARTRPLAGGVAQLVEHLMFNQRVAGSNPVAPTTWGRSPVAEALTSASELYQLRALP